MGLFRKLGILVVVTSPKWSLMLVTAPGHHPGIRRRSTPNRGYQSGYRPIWSAPAT